MLRPYGLFLLSVSLLLGCGQKTSVSGKVTYNGEIVEKGMISFKPVGNTGRSFGSPIENGAYEVADAQSGKWTAVVIGVKKINFGMSSEEAARMANENKAPGALAGHVSEAADYIPADAEGNSREVEITSGSQSIDFAITGPPRT
jgi:hypothetical protein